LDYHPKPEFIYGGLFSLIAYPIYAIGFRYDSLDSYSTLPISRADVYKSKLLLFTVIGIPLSIIFYTPFVLTDTGITSYLQGGNCTNWTYVLSIWIINVSCKR